MSNRGNNSLVRVVFVFLFACCGWSQTSTTELSGTVYDPSGAVVTGAVVTVVNSATGNSLKQITNSAGLYSFPSIAIGTYTLTVEMPGFKTAQRTGIALVVGTPATTNVTLDVGASSDVVKVEASTTPVNTDTATLGNVVERQAVAVLPLNGRNPINLVVLEPGVTQQSGTGINANGLRSQAGNVTIDGIVANETSNPTPTNNVFRINPDNVEEFKITTSNPTAEEGKNSGMNVAIATRSGTNQYHVQAIEYFRNRDLNSNEFYANAQGNSRANLNANQYGFDGGGPIKKNRTFFYGAWQGQKVNGTVAIDKALGHVPLVYTPAALNGVFRYWVSNPASPLTLNGVKITSNTPSLVTSGGALASGIRNCASPTDSNCVASYNMYANDPAHIGGDPAVLKLLGSYPAPNDFNTGDGLNTAGYLWNTPYGVRGPRQLIRVDHTINDANHIFFRVMWATEQQIKGDPLNSSPVVFPGFPPKDEVYRPAQNYALSWRWVISTSMVNELTLGFSRFTFHFTECASNPECSSQPAYTFNNVDVSYNNTPTVQRTLNTPQFIDNLAWTRGAHQLKFGANVRLNQQNDSDGSVGGQNVTPSISLSASLLPPGSAFNLPPVATSTTPGISSADDSRLLSAINDLLGIPAQLKQAFIGNLNSNTFLPIGSRWVVGAREKEINGYVQDQWRVKKNLTLISGIRWEWNRPATEVSQDPYIPNLNINGSQGPVTFVKSDSWWKRQNANAFAPRLGLSWSPFGNDKTVVAAGYGISFDSIPTYYPGAEANSQLGLAAVCTATTYASTTAGCGSVPANTRLSQGFPGSLPPPVRVTPQSLLTPAAQLYGVAPPAVILDSNLKMPTIHQWNVTIQQELPGGFVLQTGYVGNRGERLLSQLDANQINAAPILPSFNAMEANLKAGCKPDGSGCPAGVAAQTVPLVASGILSSTFVNSSSSLTDLAQNAAGDFAGRIEQTTLAAHLRPNQQFSSIIFVSNQADSVYHSMQTTIRKRFASGLLFNVAYTLSRVIDDQSGNPIGTNFTPTTSTAIDNNNLRLDRGRADFDQRHVIALTWIYELPFGKGKRWMSSAPRTLSAIVGGWSLQGFNSNMSGEPFSITSGAKTANYSAVSRAVINGSTQPSDALTPGALGPVYFTNATAFSLPAPGAQGSGRNLFNGPWFWDMDGAVSKTFAVTERVKVSLRMEAFNALNHANFRKLSGASVGSNSILSPNFGTACCQTLNTTTSTAILSNGEPYRVVQFVLKAAF
jgi:Carboxypeptidase regulatory-like domain